MLEGSCFYSSVPAEVVPSALEIFLLMRYINLRLLTYHGNPHVCIILQLMLFYEDKSSIFLSEQCALQCHKLQQVFEVQSFTNVLLKF